LERIHTHNVLQKNNQGCTFNHAVYLTSTMVRGKFYE
jgi:hypothetical protein